MKQLGADLAIPSLEMATFMGCASRYWQLVRLDRTGQRRVETLAAAKTFFQQQFPDFITQTDVPDVQINRELLRQLQVVDEPTDRSICDLAERCLRCFISHQIEQVCIQLEIKFGANHGFTRHDLFPFVLDDDGQPIVGATPYRSFASQVLQTFDPQRAGLSTWVLRQVRQHRELSAFLREQGVYLISDWAILNDTQPGQLQRILAEFYALAQAEIESACYLLQAYHQVYRRDRVRQRQSGKLKGKAECLPPTSDQLTRIAQALHQQTGIHLSNEQIMSKLQHLAKQLRQYRLHARGGGLPAESIDQIKIGEQAVDIPAPEPDLEQEEQNDFLTFYREQLLTALDEAIEQVTRDRLHYLQRKNSTTAQQFLTALRLFHCQGQSMADIARQIGLQAQFQVSRLIKLKELRGSIRQRLLKLLLNSVLEKAKHYAEPMRLHNLDHQVENALDEQITTMMREAENEAAVAKRHPLTSLFARRLCHYLDTHGVLP